MEFLNDLMRGGLAGKMPIILLALVLIVMAARVLGSTPVVAGEVMSAAEAHDKASKGEIVLVDVRTPQEWQQTGLPASAHAISMHQQGSEFLRQLDVALGGDRSKPLAVICRTGNRTTSITKPLEQAGYKRVINVAEGMAGSRHGQGWVKSGLPVRKYEAGQSAPAAVATQH